MEENNHDRVGMLSGNKLQIYEVSGAVIKIVKPTLAEKDETESLLKEMYSTARLVITAVNDGKLKLEQSKVHGEVLFVKTTNEERNEFPYMRIDPDRPDIAFVKGIIDPYTNWSKEEPNLSLAHIKEIKDVLLVIKDWVKNP